MIEKDLDEKTTFAGGFFFSFIEEFSLTSNSDELAAFKKSGIIFDHARADEDSSAFDEALGFETRKRENLGDDGVETRGRNVDSPFFFTDRERAIFRREKRAFHRSMTNADEAFFDLGGDCFEKEDISFFALN